jgi:ubiquinone/menaquinone biosynthesis C-methylase UbiE
MEWPMKFDDQAERFDDCSGLEPAAGRAIAQSVLELTGCGANDIVLDVGAGTGAIGWHFAALACRYIGLDASPAMLAVFQRKLQTLSRGTDSCLLLLQTDSDGPWPIEDQTMAVVLASRVVHLLQVDHLVQEVWRVGRPGAYLLLGRVTRDPDSLKSKLQRQKRMVLKEHGIATRSSGQAAQQVLDICLARGATPLPARTAARWARTTTARQAIAAWENKPRLSNSAEGGEMDAGLRQSVLDALTDWARQEFGDLDCPVNSTEEYTLQGVRLP